MSTPISGSGDKLDSAAKLTLMLEALAKASAEVDKAVNILAEQLTRFNQGLDKPLRDEVLSTYERMEAVLRQNQEGLLKDKESALKALSELKQAELEKVISSGKTVRTVLANQVDDASKALSATVADKIVSFKEHLAKPEIEMKRKYDELALALQAAASEAQNQLSLTRVAEEDLLNSSSGEFDGKVVQALKAGQQNLDSSFTQKRVELEAECENVLAEMSKKYDEVIERLKHSNQEGLTVLDQDNQQAASKLEQLSEAGAEFFASQDKAFQDTLNGLSGLLNGLYETHLNNLAAQSRTEIVSAAQHAEECLTTTKAELHVCLIEFQRDYVMQFEALNTGLEKTLEEYSRRGAMRGLKEEHVSEQLHSLFRRLGLKMIDSATNASRLLEAEFQKSMDAFEQRIETAKTQACDSLTHESNLMQNELTRSFQEFDKQLVKLRAQASHLETKGRDAANFVMTIRQANLDF